MEKDGKDTGKPSPDAREPQGRADHESDVQREMDELDRAEKAAKEREERFQEYQRRRRIEQWQHEHEVRRIREAFNSDTAAYVVEEARQRLAKANAWLVAYSKDPVVGQETVRQVEAMAQELRQQLEVLRRLFPERAEQGPSQKAEAQASDFQTRIDQEIEASEARAAAEREAAEAAEAVKRAEDPFAEILRRLMDPDFSKLDRYLEKYPVQEPGALLLPEPENVTVAGYAEADGAESEIAPVSYQDEARPGSPASPYEGLILPPGVTHPEEFLKKPGADEFLRQESTPDPSFKFKLSFRRPPAPIDDSWFFRNEPRPSHPLVEKVKDALARSADTVRGLLAQPAGRLGLGAAGLLTAGIIGWQVLGPDDSPAVIVNQPVVTGGAPSASAVSPASGGSTGASAPTRGDFTYSANVPQVRSERQSDGRRAAVVYAGCPYYVDGTATTAWAAGTLRLISSDGRTVYSAAVTRRTDGKGDGDRSFQILMVPPEVGVFDLVIAMTATDGQQIEDKWHFPYKVVSEPPPPENRVGWKSCKETPLRPSP
jgi:hypothetical protein